MKKRCVGNGSVNGPVHLAAVESEILGLLPQILAHLVTTRYDDGSRRQTGTITLRTLGATWQADARDWDAQARLKVIGQSVDGVLLLLDQLLGADDAPWEPDDLLRQM